MDEPGVQDIMTRNGEAADWASYNVVPKRGQMCLETDTFRFKVGDGITHYNDLPYWETLTRIEVVPGTTYTLDVADNNAILLCTNALGCIVTLPKFSDVAIPPGFITHVHQDNIVEVELVAASGVTTKTAIGLKTRVQNSSLSIICQGESIFKIIGDAKA